MQCNIQPNDEFSFLCTLLSLICSSVCTCSKSRVLSSCTLVCNNFVYDSGSGPVTAREGVHVACMTGGNIPLTVYPLHIYQFFKVPFIGFIYMQLDCLIYLTPNLCFFLISFVLSCLHDFFILWLMSVLSLKFFGCCYYRHCKN